MDDGLLFIEQKLNNKFLKDCEIVYKDKTDNIRLYFNKNTDGNGFYAKAVEFYSCGCDNEKTCWENETLTVEEIFELTAYYDGVRHIWFYNNDEGYTNYPNIGSFSDIFKKIKELEKQYCNTKN